MKYHPGVSLNTCDLHRFSTHGEPEITIPKRHINTFNTVQITFIFIDFRVCDFAFAFKTPNAPCVSRFKRVSDRFQFAF